MALPIEKTSTGGVLLRDGSGFGAGGGHGSRGSLVLDRIDVVETGPVLYEVILIDESDL